MDYQILLTIPLTKWDDPAKYLKMPVMDPASSPFPAEFLLGHELPDETSRISMNFQQSYDWFPYCTAEYLGANHLEITGACVVFDISTKIKGGTTTRPPGPSPPRPSRAPNSFKSLAKDLSQWSLTDVVLASAQQNPRLTYVGSLHFSSYSPLERSFHLFISSPFALCRMAAVLGRNEERTTQNCRTISKNPPKKNSKRLSRVCLTTPLPRFSQNVKPSVATTRDPWPHAAGAPNPPSASSINMYLRTPAVEDGG
jgi:hypothetical protein